MKAQFNVTKNLMIEIEEDSQTELFRGLAVAQEVFGETTCEACKSENISYRVRTVDDNDFYELVCKACKAVLKFGQHKKGKTLFPVRKDDSNGYKKNNGWEKYVPQAKTET